MATATYEPIATTTFASAATSYTFSSIPNTYTDLVVIGVLQASGGSTNLRMQYNGDTATNYSNTVLYGDGTSAASTRITSQAQLSVDYQSNELTTTFNMVKIDIFSYAGSTYKTALSSGNNAATSGVDAIVGLWRSTAAITSIKLFSANANPFAVGTTFTLYGIKAA